ncbi:putative F-box protein At5g42430 [Eutrema salsugineum]|uniref:putative F-box protein At5g42430 n=1 Tax=Eutrema salsugineum TaxID=72664 RepID=UPI000CED73FF|nr:putative F-box protein At5g42430 [Eutrema salsugineum]
MGSWTSPRILFILKGHRQYSVFSSPQLQNPYGKSSSLVISADFHVKFSDHMWSAEFCGVTNGLIYYSSMTISEKKSEDAVVPMIFNPITRQYASLPKMTKDGAERASVLGFDPIDKQFKVLAMAAYPYANEREDNRILILTLGTGEMSWRKIQCPFPHYHYSLREGICINGGKLGVINRKFYGGSNILEFHLLVLEDVEKQEWLKYVYILPDIKLVDLRYVYVVGVTATGEIVFVDGKYISTVLHFLL